MKADYKVRDFMTQNPFFIGAGETVVTAKKMMHEHKIRHLPVLQNGEVFGIVSDRDIKMATGLVGASPDLVLVRHICRENPYQVDPDSLLYHVAEAMSMNRYGCALVTHNKKLLGIFTTVDACRALSVVLREHSEAHASEVHGKK